MQWDVQAIVGLIAIAIGFGAVVVYPKLQYNALRRLRGIWRALSVLPLVVMAAVVAVTVPALAEGANLWPLLLIFITPFATAYLGALFVVHRFVERRRGRNPAAAPLH